MFKATPLDRFFLQQRRIVLCQLVPPSVLWFDHLFKQYKFFFLHGRSTCFSLLFLFHWIEIWLVWDLWFVVHARIVRTMSIFAIDLKTFSFLTAPKTTYPDEVEFETINIARSSTGSATHIPLLMLYAEKIYLQNYPQTTHFDIVYL